MELQEVIEKRRSIRDYVKGVVIPKEDIDQIISAAIMAPSWKNSQTARYVVVTSEECKNKLREEALPPFNQNNTVSASAYIITSFVKNRAGFDTDGNPDNELGNEWGAYDLGLANSLLCLKAVELGYDTLIMGIRNSDKLRELFDIPESEEVVSVLGLGKRNVEPKMPPRKAVEDVTRFF